MLQAAMAHRVAKGTNDGNFLDPDTETGNIYARHPVTAHAIIMQVGEHYVY